MTISLTINLRKLNLAQLAALYCALPNDFASAPDPYSVERYMLREVLNTEFPAGNGDAAVRMIQATQKWI